MVTKTDLAELLRLKDEAEAAGTEWAVRLMVRVIALAASVRELERVVERAERLAGGD